MNYKSVVFRKSTDFLNRTDRLTRFTYLIATKKTDDAAETARRLFAAIFAVHGTPLQINSDRDVRRVAGFFKELTRILKIDQKIGTAYDHEF